MSEFEEAKKMPGKEDVERLAMVDPVIHCLLAHHKMFPESFSWEQMLTCMVVEQNKQLEVYRKEALTRFTRSIIG